MNNLEIILVNEIINISEAIKNKISTHIGLCGIGRLRLNKNLLTQLYPLFRNKDFFTNVVYL